MGCNTNREPGRHRRAPPRTVNWPPGGRTRGAPASTPDAEPLALSVSKRGPGDDLETSSAGAGGPPRRGRVRRRRSGGPFRQVRLRGAHGVEHPVAEREPRADRGGQRAAVPCVFCVSTRGAGRSITSDPSQKTSTGAPGRLPSLSRARAERPQIAGGDPHRGEVANRTSEQSLRLVQVRGEERRACGNSSST